jgi:hypothetical protein
VFTISQVRPLRNVMTSPGFVAVGPLTLSALATAPTTLTGTSRRAIACIAARTAAPPDMSNFMYSSVAELEDVPPASYVIPFPASASGGSSPPPIREQDEPGRFALPRPTPRMPPHRSRASSSSRQTSTSMAELGELFRVGREVLGRAVVRRRVHQIACLDARLGRHDPQPDGLVGSPGIETRRDLEQDAAEGTPVLLGAEALEAVSAE